MGKSSQQHLWDYLLQRFFVEIMMMKRNTDVPNNPSSKRISKSKTTKTEKSEISDKEKPSEEESNIEDDTEKAKQLMKEVSLTD